MVTVPSWFIVPSIDSAPSSVSAFPLRRARRFPRRMNCPATSDLIGPKPSEGLAQAAGDRARAAKAGDGLLPAASFERAAPAFAPRR